jgi:hypothetical protein
MNRSLINPGVLGLLAICNVFAAGGCGSSKTSGGYCNLDDGRRIQSGAAFGDGCNCCVCTSSGQAVCQAAGCSADGGAAVAAKGPCQTDDDCVSQGRQLCVFDPGCDSPRGTCIGTIGVCPNFALSEPAPYEYCGCDGLTYSTIESPQPREYPYKPYRHFGACP